MVAILSYFFPKSVTIIYSANIFSIHVPFAFDTNNIE